MPKRTAWLTPGTIFYLNQDNDPTAQIVTVPGDKYPVQIQNMGEKEWIVETPSGRLNKVMPKGTMPVKAGLKVKFDSTHEGTII